MNSLPRCTVDPIHYNKRPFMQAQKAAKKAAKKQSPPQAQPKQAKPKAPKVSKTATGAAYASKAKGIGMADLLSHDVSYLAGYIYVGNGTLGATDGVYYVNTAQTKLVLNHVPILACDADLGQTYVKDIEKHYARKVIKRLRVRLVSLVPATTNSMMVVISPIRGPGDSQNSSVATGTSAALTLANVIGMAGATEAASYEDATLDLTRFIAGGAGKNENEFAVNNSAASTSFVGANLLGICPACVAVSGSNSSTGLRGTVTHMVVVESVVDFLDFIAGVTTSFPISALEELARLEVLALKGDDGARHKVRQLYAERIRRLEGYPTKVMEPYPVQT